MSLPCKVTWHAARYPAEAPPARPLPTMDAQLIICPNAGNAAMAKFLIKYMDPSVLLVNNNTVYVHAAMR